MTANGTTSYISLTNSNHDGERLGVDAAIRHCDCVLERDLVERNFLRRDDRGHRQLLHRRRFLLVNEAKQIVPYDAQNVSTLPHPFPERGALHEKIFVSTLIEADQPALHYRAHYAFGGPDTNLRQPAVHIIRDHAYAATDASYYVSPTGSDSNPGTISAPFQTITKARDAVRTINASMSRTSTST